MNDSLLLVIEGVYLLERSQSPYEGDIFHETPTALFFYSYLLKLSNTALHFFFIACDITTACMLMKASSLFFHSMVYSNLDINSQMLKLTMIFTA